MANEKAEKPAKEAIKLDPQKVYTVIGAGMATKGKAFLGKGAEYEVLGADAEVLVNSGKATLKP